MRVRVAFASCAIALGLVVTLPTSAHATTYRLYTPGATGSIFTSSAIMQVCDTAADGRRAVMRVENLTNLDHYGVLQDIDGNGTCESKEFEFDPGHDEVRDGEVISVEVWIKDGANGATENYRIFNWTVQ